MNVSLEVPLNAPLSIDIPTLISEDHAVPEPPTKTDDDDDTLPENEDELLEQKEEELLEQQPEDEIDNEELPPYDQDVAEAQYDETHADNTLATRSVDEVSPNRNNVFGKYIIHETLLSYGPPEVLIASLVVYGEMETLKNDAKAAPVIHHMEKEMLTIWTHKIGSVTVKKVITKIVELAHDGTVHNTLNKILDTIMEVLTYNFEAKQVPENERVHFAWDEFRVLINAHGLTAIPTLYHGFWNIEMDGDCKNSFETILHCMMDSAPKCTVPPRFAKAGKQRQETREIKSYQNSMLPYSE